MKIVTEERDRGHVRVLEVNGERTSHLGVYDYVMRIGPAHFKMGGIGGVHTDWRHRRKGYARIVMEDCVRWMADEGYDVTMLFGIEHFYHKFGFANCGPDSSARVRTRDAEAILKQPSRYEIRPLKDSDWRSVLSIYNRNNAGRSLSIVRDPKTFRGLRHGSAFKIAAEGFVVQTKKGKVAGYAVVDSMPATTTLCEAETSQPEAMRAVLAKLVRIAISRRDGEIAAQLPSDHPFVAVLRPFGCTTTVTHRNTGAVMARFVNQSRVLEKLAAAYAAGKSATARGSARVCVNTDLGRTEVCFPRKSGGKGTVSMPATTLFQVVVGFRTVDEVILSPDVRVTGAGVDLLRFLHPDLEPCIYAVDHF